MEEKNRKLASKNRTIRKGSRRSDVGIETISSDDSEVDEMPTRKKGMRFRRM